MDALDPSLFIGSSKEAIDVARALQDELYEDSEPRVWDQGVFAPGSFALTDLYDFAKGSDFAALVVTPDDMLQRRGKQVSTARDNVIFELGLFIGVLGPRRVFILRPSDEDVWLPTDLLGVTTLSYKAKRGAKDPRPAIGPAANSIRKRIREEGVRPDRREPAASEPQVSSYSRRGLSLREERMELNRELNAIAKAAKAQSWTVRRTSSAFRIINPKGQRYSFTIGEAGETRDRLRPYASQLKKAGLRISQSVLAPVGANLQTWRPAP
jgi:hypothetical protein